MPILVKDFSWRQTDEAVIIHVPFKREFLNSVDFITENEYIKASYPPYIFEIFLYKQIKETESTCVKTSNEIIFTLMKEENDPWEKLEKDLNKSEKSKLRESVLSKVELKYKTLAKEKADRKSELHQKAVRQQIQIDDCNRKTIEGIINHERQKLATELNEWKGNETKESEVDSTFTAEKGKKCLAIPWREDKKEKTVAPVIPPPRATSSIQVSFSPRYFPTPMRESKVPEEDEWLRKQAAARRLAGFDDSELSLEEKNPMWLKEKGDSFFKIGNYQGAVAAYTYGIKLSEEMPELYANRAAAHIALGNFFKAAEDSSTALELITPQTPSNAPMRARCHAKRGAALWKLGLLDKGLIELCAARDLIKFHEKGSTCLESLDEDIKKLKLEIEKKSEDCDSNDE